MKTSTRRPVAGLVAGLLASAFLASCDAPTRPPTRGAIAPVIAMVPGDTAAGQAAASDLTAVIVTVTGTDFTRTVDFVKEGFGWRGRVTNVPEGSYTLRIEGRNVTGSTIYFGRNTSVNVVRGATANPVVEFEPTVAPATAITLGSTTSYVQTARWARIPQATDFTVEYSQSSAFGSGGSAVVTDTNYVVRVNAPGEWFVRLRANLPGVAATSVPYSPTASWTVVDAAGGNTAELAQAVTLVPQTAQTIQNRNVSSTTKTQDWFSIDALAGDTIRLETFAVRLPVPSPLNTVLTLFRADGTTQVATNDDDAVSGTTDSRLAVAAPSSENYKVRVTGNNSVGHYELQLQIRRLSTAPTGLSAQTISATRIRLGWTDASSDETSWQISRCTGAACSTFTAIATIPTGSVTYDDTAAVAGQQYTYRVRAVNAVGTSLPSNDASASTFLPPAPASFTAVTASATRIDLTWTYGPGVVDTVRVERCVGAECLDFAALFKVPSASAAVADTTATLGNVYRYRIRTQNAVGLSAYSTIATGRTTVPGAPTTLAGRAESATSISLTWIDVATDETAYEIERCVATACTYAVVATQAAGTQSYLNVGLMADSTYQFRVRALNAAGGSAYSDVVTIATKVPRAPEQLSAQPLTGTIRLTWADSSSNDEAAVVERCVGAGCSYAKLADLPGANRITYDDSTFALGTEYRYRVRYSNAIGESANSVEATIGTFAPATPTGLVVQTVSATRIDLTWADASDDETGFRIERCTGSSCTSFAQIMVVQTGTTLYQDTTAVLGNDYRYRILAVNVFGASAASGIAVANTRLPAAPTTLTAVTQPGNHIAVAWSHDGLNVTRYNVFRCTGASCTPTDSLTSTLPGVLAYTDVGLVNGQSYRYAVRAVNPAGASAASNVAESATNYPVDPVILTAAPISPTRIRITWQDNADNEVGYIVERCVGAGCASGFQNLALLAANATAFEDESTFGVDPVATGAYYGYRVRAYNNAGESRPTAIVNVRTFVPAVPTALTATVVAAKNVTLAWNDQADNEASFRVERCSGSDSCVDFTALVTSAANVGSYADTSVVVNQLYRYRIFAVNPVGDSPASNVALANVTVPPAPSAVSVVATSATGTRLFWSFTPGNELGFKVERCQGVGCTFTEIATLPPVARQFDDVVADVSNPVSYRVRAYNVVGNGVAAPDAALSVMLPAAPTNPTATPLSATRVDVSWSVAATNAVGYTVSRCTGTGCGAVEANFATLGGTADAPALTYSDLTAVANTDYTYRVRAFTGLGTSAWSTNTSTLTSVPAAPTNLIASVQNANNIALGWVNQATNALSVRVERCTGVDCELSADNFVEILQLAPDVILANDLTTVVSTAYSYRIRSVNNIGSTFSDVISLSTNVPAAPVNLTATAISGTQVQLNWTDVATNENAYLVLRCSGPGCSFQTVSPSLVPNTTAYLDAAAPFGTTHQYLVVAAGPTGNTPSANLDTASTVLDAPTLARAFTVGRTSIRFRWTDSSPIETGYTVQQCAGENCEATEANFATVSNSAANDTSFVSGGLAANTRYAYRVRAVTTGGVSDWTPLTVVASSLQLPFARTPEVLSSGVAVSATDATSKGERHFVINVPAGTPQLTVRINGGTGEPDLYVRRTLVPVAGTQPFLTDSLCVPHSGGSVETCTFTNPTPGDYFIMLQAFSPYTAVNLTATLAPTTFILQHCGATGALGPTQEQCTAAYGTGVTQVAVVNGVQNWTVPHTGRYRIITQGAVGASGAASFAAGRGARMQGEFNLTAGAVLSVAVGQAGSGTVGSNGGGGGGTFVVIGGNPIIVAGGGGGMRTDATQVGCDASITRFGVTGSGSLGSGWGCPVKGIGEGLGGALTSLVSFGAAGAGFFGNGANDFYTGAVLIGTGGRSWAGGLTGGTPQNQAACTQLGNGPGIGGFGGGGAGNGCFGGGGGGGYSGGDGGWIAGGGGSFNSGANQLNTRGLGTSNGFVILEYIGPAI